ncbi:cell division protein SepF [Geodermatophilus sp. SYSU D00758]
MAGAMRKMGIYLGLVEDDDARAYGRYDARQAEYADRHDRLDERGVDERRYARYADDEAYGSYKGDRYEDPYKDDHYGDPGYADHDFEAEADPSPAPDPEPVALPRRPAPARRLDLAPSADRPERPLRAAGLAPAGATASAAASSPGAGAGVGAAGLAVREPAVAPVAAAPEPAPAPAPAPKPYRITTLHPRTYNEARQIGESFRDGMPVIMNLTEMDDADAKRLVDFAAGLSFGLRGSIERVTNKVFLLSPRDVDVTAEDKARIREGGFFNQS